MNIKSTFTALLLIVLPMGFLSAADWFEQRAVSSSYCDRCSRAPICCCPDDYCRKPLPCVECVPNCGCCDDYCRKPLPGVCPVPCGFLYCYDAKPLPCVFGPRCDQSCMCPRPKTCFGASCCTRKRIAPRTNGTSVVVPDDQFDADENRVTGPPVVEMNPSIAPTE